MSKVQAESRYGRLIAIRVIEPDRKGGELWEFKCDCGALVRRQDYRVVDYNKRRSSPMCDSCRDETFMSRSCSIAPQRNVDRDDCKHYTECLNRVTRLPVRQLPDELRRRDHVCTKQCNKFIMRQDSAVDHTISRHVYTY